MGWLTFWSDGLGDHQHSQHVEKNGMHQFKIIFILPLSNLFSLLGSSTEEDCISWQSEAMGISPFFVTDVVVLQSQQHMTNRLA